jgi:hypothetical protein
VSTVCYIAEISVSSEFFCVHSKSRFLVAKFNYCCSLLNFILHIIAFVQIRRQIVHVGTEMFKWHVIFL